MLMYKLFIDNPEVEGSYSIRYLCKRIFLSYLHFENLSESERTLLREAHGQKCLVKWAVLSSL